MTYNKTAFSALLGLSTLALTPFSEAQITAGIDFDVPSGSGAVPPSTTYTESGFLSVPATGEKDYNVTHNGITFDIKATNANLTNQNRWRGGNTDTLNNLPPLAVDFIQWFGDTGEAVEVTFTLTGLQANIDYELSFTTFNAGAGQTTHTFYEGASAATGTLLSAFTTVGNQNREDWEPSVLYTLNSGSNGEIVVTIEGTVSPDNNQSRITFPGMSITSLGTPPLDLDITSIAVDPDTDELTMTFTGLPNTAYACKSSTDLTEFTTTETPINETSLVTDENGQGTFVLDATGFAKKFYRMEVLP